jgi:hypothetical protein
VLSQRIARNPGSPKEKKYGFLLSAAPHIDELRKPASIIYNQSLLPGVPHGPEL